MKIISPTVVVLASAGYASAALCVTKGLLGIGAPETLTQTFALKARNTHGNEFLVVNDPAPLPGGFFLPLKLGAANAPLDSFTTPIFQLQNSMAYAQGGTILASQSASLLSPQPLFVAADSSQVQQRVVAVDAICGGKKQQVLRFSAIGPLSIASAAVKGTFQPGAGLLTPIADNVLGVGSQIDLILVPHNASTS